MLVQSIRCLTFFKDSTVRIKLFHFLMDNSFVLPLVIFRQGKKYRQRWREPYYNLFYEKKNKFILSIVKQK